MVDHMSYNPSTGGSPSWSSVTGKPSTFPPETPQAISHITGLQSALDGKQVAGSYQPLTPGYLRHRQEVASILDPRKWPLEWLEGEISEGRIAILENDTAIIGVEKKVYPGGYVELHGMFAAGELNGILELIDAAVQVAEAQGMDGATISSREGWARILKSRGFVPQQLTITKEFG